MLRSIATAPDAAPLPERRDTGIAGRARDLLERVGPVQIGFLFIVIGLIVYVFSHPSRSGSYDHFVWQADAFLRGRVGIAWPVTDGPFTNGYFQDVMPQPLVPGEPSSALLPFPPLPAILLLPFVALFGLATDAQLVGAVLGAINVGLAWRLTTRLTDDRVVSVLATTFFGFGTVHWYAAMLSTTWFLAHVLATTLLLLSITLALDAERRERIVAAIRALGAAGGQSRSPIVTLFEGNSLFLAWHRRLRGQLDPFQFMAGFVFGVAALARLTVLFAAPFYLFAGGGGSIWRRGLSAGLGAVIPVLLLVAYNVVATGHLFNPAYEYLYQTEYLGYMPADLAINREYGIEDVRHVPVNMLIMFLWPPIVDAGCGLPLLNPECPPIRPDQIGMSIILTSPAYLLAVSLIVHAWRERIVLGAVLAIVAVAFVNLMHFSQGWVQFGYRFSNDFAPFALVLVTLAMTRMRHLWPAALLVGLSVLVNAWGVYWGVRLGW